MLGEPLVSAPDGTYRSWFLWEERLKNFRFIRTGLEVVVAEIEAATFGNLYRGSSLETVVGSIAEQRQIFKGADHAFLWKLKLRIRTHDAAAGIPVAATSRSVELIGLRRSRARGAV